MSTIFEEMLNHSQNSPTIQDRGTATSSVSIRGAPDDDAATRGRTEEFEKIKKEREAAEEMIVHADIARQALAQFAQGSRDEIALAVANSVAARGGDDNVLKLVDNMLVDCFKLNFRVALSVPFNAVLFNSTN